jgi:rare lipoprotein A (peptidoglycan hydrolase)
MYTSRTLAAALALSALSLMLCERALAQSFDERWSIVPKAKAEEPQTPGAPAEMPASEVQDNPSLETTGESAATIGPRGEQPGRGRRSEHDGAPKRAFGGKASYISYAGGKTASGAPYRPQALTAAHRTLPFGTRLRVTDVKTGRQVEVTVNDRGPHIGRRVLDLSRGAAEVLGMKDRGVIQVRAEVLS